MRVSLLASLAANSLAPFRMARSLTEKNALRRSTAAAAEILSSHGLERHNCEHVCVLGYQQGGP